MVCFHTITNLTTFMVMHSAVTLDKSLNKDDYRICCHSNDTHNMLPNVRQGGIMLCYPIHALQWRLKWFMFQFPNISSRSY